MNTVHQCCNEQTYNKSYITNYEQSFCIINVSYKEKCWKKINYITRFRKSRSETVNRWMVLTIKNTLASVLIIIHYCLLLAHRVFTVPSTIIMESSKNILPRPSCPYYMVLFGMISKRPFYSENKQLRSNYFKSSSRYSS